MTVYVDDMLMEATVGRIRSRWSHLMADTTDELNAFAAKLGMRPQWLQHAGRPTEHYDLTEGKRKQAIRLGATPIVYGGEESMNLIRRKLAARDSAGAQ